MKTIREFIEDRIREDEQIALGAKGLATPERLKGQPEAWARYLRLIPPQRLLREVDLKRGLLFFHQPHEGTRTIGIASHWYCEECSDNWPCKTVRQIASLYDWHKDYNADWR